MGGLNIQAMMKDLLSGAGAKPPAPPMAGGPEGSLDVLANMQQSPQPEGDESMLQQASTLIGQVASRFSLRSAGAAKDLTDALSKIQSAREKLGKEGSRPLAPPPDLALAGTGPGGFPGGAPPGATGR